MIRKLFSEQCFWNWKVLDRDVGSDAVEAGGRHQAEGDREDSWGAQVQGSMVVRKHPAARLDDTLGEQAILREVDNTPYHSTVVAEPDIRMKGDSAVGQRIGLAGYCNLGWCTVVDWKRERQRLVGRG